MRRFAAWCVPLACTGCLPGDTRPPPAELTVTASSSGSTLNDIVVSTSDGFDIHVERLVVNVGQAGLGNAKGSTACNEYSNPDYTRLFDFKQVTAPREVGLAFATGRCAFGYSFRFPNYATVIDLGATGYDATLMRIPASDPDATDAGVSAFIQGVAVRGAETKQFTWPFRKRVAYDDCGTLDDAGGFNWGISLSSNEKKSVNLEVHAEALFQNRSNKLAYFQPFADADANGDDDIAFEELWTVPLDAVIATGFDAPPPDISVPPPPSPPNAPSDPAYFCYDGNGDPITIKTLGDYVYCELLPALVRFGDTGACTVRIGRSNHEDN